MLGKSSVLMMLLLGTGSLVGISSIYTPANVETQPQPQPQKPQTTLEAVKPGLSTQLTTGQRVVDPQVARAMEENQLLNRLLPKIIERIDVKLVPTARPGQTAKVDVTPLFAHKTATVTAKCAPGETIVSGGMSISPNGKVSYSTQSGRQDNSWAIISTFDGDGGVTAVAQCLKVELSLKSPQQPQAQQPSPPPGGPPLQPPPEFGK